MPSVSKQLKKTFLNKWLTMIRNRNLKTETLPATLHNQITQKIYKKEILNLERLISRELGSWLELKQY